jgi:5-enolpyruvylshikimate-3-phosphate synthase
MIGNPHFPDYFMHKLLVTGGSLLEGDVYVSGSKNSALPILAATLLTRDRCVIHRVPDLSDTNYMTQILASLGAHVERASGTVMVVITRSAPATASVGLARAGAAPWATARARAAATAYGRGVTPASLSPAAEHAAWTQVASLLFNLSETITRN